MRRGSPLLRDHPLALQRDLTPQCVECRRLQPIHDRPEVLEKLADARGRNVSGNCCCDVERKEAPAKVPRKLTQTSSRESLKTTMVFTESRGNSSERSRLSADKKSEHSVAHHRPDHECALIRCVRVCRSVPPAGRRKGNKKRFRLEQSSMAYPLVAERHPTRKRALHKPHCRHIRWRARFCSCRLACNLACPPKRPETTKFYRAGRFNNERSAGRLPGAFFHSDYRSRS